MLPWNLHYLYCSFDLWFWVRYLVVIRASAELMSYSRFTMIELWIDYILGFCFRWTDAAMRWFCWSLPWCITFYSAEPTFCYNVYFSCGELLFIPSLQTPLAIASVWDDLTGLFELTLSILWIVQDYVMEMVLSGPPVRQVSGPLWTTRCCVRVYLMSSPPLRLSYEVLC
jgi:hypothetical protein